MGRESGFCWMRDNFIQVNHRLCRWILRVYVVVEISGIRNEEDKQLDRLKGTSETWTFKSGQTIF